MQKKFILLTIFIMSTCSALQSVIILPENIYADEAAAAKTSVPSSDMTTTSSEEFNVDDELGTMQEYDQYVTDTVTPPTVSNAEIMFRNILGSLLLKYIQLREKTHYYVEKMKNNCTRLYRNTFNYFQK